jgi:ribosome maturation factor RimP
MSIEETIETLITPLLQEDGYDIVRIHISGGTVSKRLQIMIEHTDLEKNITVEDCAKVSRIASVYLEQEDLIKDHYILEVSSPGLDRPLTKPKHFYRFCGEKVKVQTFSLVHERKRFKGTLIDANNKGITIHVDDDTTDNPHMFIDYQNIQSAKLFSAS